MLALASCLLLAAPILAADYAPYIGQESHQVAPTYFPPTETRYPIDYNDDFRVKPGSNIIYNFEQLRRDQPPQVEMRDEDVGRYMYRKHRTTTVPPAPMVSRFNDFVVSVPDSSKVQPQARYPDAYREWHDGPSTTMAPPPPPPSPKWMDLPQDYGYHAKPQHHSTPSWNAATDYHPQNNFPSEPVSSTPFAPAMPVHWSDPTMSQDYRHHQMQPTAAPRYGHFPRREEMSSPVTTVQPHWTELISATESFARQPVAHSRPQQNSRNAANRGSHKFNWNDVTAVEALHQASTPNPQSFGPPQSIPTLTPWHGDNFGK